MMWSFRSPHRSRNLASCQTRRRTKRRTRTRRVRTCSRRNSLRAARATRRGSLGCAAPHSAQRRTGAAARRASPETRVAHAFILRRVLPCPAAAQVPFWANCMECTVNDAFKDRDSDAFKYFRRAPPTLSRGARGRSPPRRVLAPQRPVCFSPPPPPHPSSCASLRRRHLPAP